MEHEKADVQMIITTMEARTDVLEISYGCGGMDNGGIQSLHMVNKAV